jgi:hypothetical protein
MCFALLARRIVAAGHWRLIGAGTPAPACITYAGGSGRADPVPTAVVDRGTVAEKPAEPIRSALLSVTVIRVVAGTVTCSKPASSGLRADMTAFTAVIGVGLEVDTRARPIDATDREAGAAGFILADFQLVKAHG